MDMPDAFGGTGHVKAIGSKLLGDGRMGDDDAWNCGSVVRPNENGQWASSISTIVNRHHSQETNANGMMHVVANIKETDVGAR